MTAKPFELMRQNVANRPIGILVLGLLAAVVQGAPPASQPSEAVIEVFAGQRQQRVWPEVIGINLNPDGRVAAIHDPRIIESVKRIGIRSVRFPNGCVADRYNFKTADGKNEVTVQQFLDFCDAIGAEPYYTLNLQGGTENKEGPVPQNTPLPEAVKYRHTAPNPCGWTDYYFGTLPEAVELVRMYTVQRALAGRRPILCYEMGNENWGQATTDWWPELYAATIGEFARAIREVVAEVRQQHPQLKDLDLHITAVGYPMMGNNQDPTQTANREINLRWTREVNALRQAGLIDAVQDHLYPYNGDASDLLVWTQHNMQNILHARRGLPNSRLGGYLDQALGYQMPIEITEWNLKCWGEQAKRDIVASSLDFEAGVKGWQRDHVGGGQSVRALAQAGRRGTGLRLAAGQKSSEPVRVWQVFEWTGGDQRRLYASAWVRTNRPDNLSLWLVPANEDGTPGAPPAEGWRRAAARADHWHKIVVGGEVPKGTKRFAVGFSLAGPDAQADVDAVDLFHWGLQPGLAPTGVDTAAQQLLILDATRVMIEHGVRRAHLHHLFGSYPCGIMHLDGRPKDNYSVFEFLAGGLGSHTVKTTLDCQTFDHNCLADKFATDFNAMAPDVKNVPVLSALGMRDQQHVYVLVVNRTTDVPVQATIRVYEAKLAASMSIRSLTCDDFDLPGVKVTEQRRQAKDSFTHRIEPHAAYLFKLETSQ